MLGRSAQKKFEARWKKLCPSHSWTSQLYSLMGRTINATVHSKKIDTYYCGKMDPLRVSG